ncbi:multidrug effflux MFS transporter, partial [Pseudomaricurvus alcaniphilus]|uniref:multidrug effflux MFS transporter n=1 Tax=Pseudomaricurvus alcaniphilus TaxID=1166482 RepID=UPI00140B908A
SAVYGFAAWLTVYFWLPETRKPMPAMSVWTQLSQTFSLVKSSPQAKTGIALFTLPFVGYFAILTSLSVVMHDLYGVTAAEFGLLFALAAVSYFIGALATRHLSVWLPPSRTLLIGMGILGLTGLLSFSLLFWQAPAWVLWVTASLYMLGMAICLPITSLEALGPLAKSAGLGASVLSTFQIGVGALGSFLSAYYYDGTQTSLFLVTTVVTLAAVAIYAKRRRTLFQSR